MPGYITRLDTLSELWGTMMSTEDKKNMFKTLTARFPTGRIGQPEDIAEAYLWLIKDKNVTGSVVSSDSGAMLV